MLYSVCLIQLWLTVVWLLPGADEQEYRDAAQSIHDARACSLASVHRVTATVWHRREAPRGRPADQTDAIPHVTAAEKRISVPQQFSRNSHLTVLGREDFCTKPWHRLHETHVMSSTLHDTWELDTVDSNDYLSTTCIKLQNTCICYSIWMYVYH